MKRSMTVLLLIGIAVTAAAGAKPDLAGWIPPDGQLVIEIPRLSEAMAPFTASGATTDPAARLQQMWPELRLPWVPSQWPTTGPEDWPAISVMLAVARGADASPESAHGLLVLGLATEELYERFAGCLQPPNGSPVVARAAGPYTIYAAEAESGFLVIGGGTVVLGRGFDATALTDARRDAVSPLARTAAAAPAMSLPGDTILRLRINLTALGILSDETMRAAAGRIVQSLQAPPDATAADSPELPALRGLFSRVTPDQMTAFLTGLGLDSLRALTLTVAGDTEQIGLALALEVDREQGLVQDYLTGLRQRRLSAWPLLPADVLVVLDSLTNAPHLIRLLREHSRSTLGPSGETAFIGLELAASTRLGVSFMEQILPLLGTEWGVVVLPGKTGEPPRLAGFCVPEDPTLLPVVLTKLAPRVPLGVTPPDPAGEPYYTLNLNPSADKPSIVYLLPVGPAVFVSDRPDALREILSAGQSGATFRPPLSPDSPADTTCIQLIYGRSDLLGGLGLSDSAASPTASFFGQSNLSDTGITAGFRMPRTLLTGLGRLLPGLLGQVLPQAEAPDLAPQSPADTRP